MARSTGARRLALPTHPPTGAPMSNRISRRVAAGLGLTTVLAGAAFGAGPAMAVTHSTCTYDKNSKSVVVNDYSGADRLRLFNDHGVIAVEDGFTVTTLCRE